jgi:hypothetical protein
MTIINEMLASHEMHPEEAGAVDALLDLAKRLFQPARIYGSQHDVACLCAVCDAVREARDAGLDE